MMERAGDSDKIRLPELPVFKRFSLALRQEYATAEEILAVIDRTVSRIKDVIDRDEEIRRRAREQEIEEQRAAYAEEYIEDEQLDDERFEELIPQPDEIETQVASEEPLPDESPLDRDMTTDEEITALLTAPEPSLDSIFPLEDQEVDSLIPEEDEIATLIRPEVDERGTPSVAQARSAAKAIPSTEEEPKPEPQREVKADLKPKPKPAAKKKSSKRKPAGPEIVRVSKHGKPLGLSKVRKQINDETPAKPKPSPSKSVRTSRGKSGKTR